MIAAYIAFTSAVTESPHLDRLVFFAQDKPPCNRLTTHTRDDALDNPSDMHISTLVPLLAALAGASAAAVVSDENHVQVARAQAPAVQLQARQFTRVQSRDKDPEDEWGGWGESNHNTPFRFEFKKGYTKESFTLSTYAATKWYTDGMGGWIDESGPEPTPEHTLHVSVSRPLPPRAQV